jgi:hypothetical protein
MSCFTAPLFRLGLGFTAVILSGTIPVWACSKQNFGLDAQALVSSERQLEHIEQLINERDRSFAQIQMRGWSQQFRAERFVQLEKCQRHSPLAHQLLGRWRIMQERADRLNKELHALTDSRLCEKREPEIRALYESAINALENGETQKVHQLFYQVARESESLVDRGDCQEQEKAMLLNIAHHSWLAMPVGVERTEESHHF